MVLTTWIQAAYWLWAPKTVTQLDRNPECEIHSIFEPWPTTYTVSLTYCLLLSQLLAPHWHLKCMTNQLVTFLKGKSIKRGKLWGLLLAAVYDWHLGQLTWNTISWCNQPMTSQTGQLDRVAAICMSCRTEKYFIRPNEKDYIKGWTIPDEERYDSVGQIILLGVCMCYSPVMYLASTFINISPTNIWWKKEKAPERKHFHV